MNNKNPAKHAAITIISKNYWLMGRFEEVAVDDLSPLLLSHINEKPIAVVAQSAETPPSPKIEVIMELISISATLYSDLEQLADLLTE